MVHRGHGPSSPLDPTHGETALRSWMQQGSLVDSVAVLGSLEQVRQLGIPADLQSLLWEWLPPLLRETVSPDESFQLFTRFLSRTLSPQSLLALFERDRLTLSQLIAALSIGPKVAESLIEDPETFELLRITDGCPSQRQALIDEIKTEVSTARDERQVSRSLHRFHQREMARIAYGCFRRRVPIEETCRQLSHVAEAILQSAYDFAHRHVAERIGEPRLFQGQPARGSLIALERLGGAQLGFESTLDAILIAETQGQTSSARLVSNADFFERLSRILLEVLSGASLGLPGYHLRLLKPPLMKSSPLVLDSHLAFQHYDLRGRTWERMTFVRARPVAGDWGLGDDFIERLQPWVFRRYLSEADIAGLSACQRKLQRRLAFEAYHRSGAADDRQAADDIEQTVLFLQLLHGHQYPSIRVANTFEAMGRLHAEHLLRDSEQQLLAENYAICRQAEAQRCLRGTSATRPPTAEERRELAESIEVSRRIISARLEESFPESHAVPEETDLILDPQPSDGWIQRLLSQHRFKKPRLAYEHLMKMAEEEIAILSTRRCRYFLSLIAPHLLQLIGQTPAPDQTLDNLASMSVSLGGKGVLWELLHSNPATMHLIVRLCACGQYLVRLITQSPGMIDELMDSLILDRLPRLDELETMLTELCRQSDDTERVVHEFKQAMHLRVGVRDILGKDSVLDTHRALSNIAEACLLQIIHDEYAQLVERYGLPSRDDGRTVAFAVLGLGKLGGQEPNYHSDLSVIVLFEQDGVTRNEKSRSESASTTCRHFFEQLAQRLMRRCNRPNSRHGRLYELDVRFGPLGKSGVLAMELEPFLRYFDEPNSSTIERLSLCKARPIAGRPGFSSHVMQAIGGLIQRFAFTDKDREALLNYRDATNSTASIQNIKRSEGGTVDVECLVQSLQLKHASAIPEILVPGTLEAIRALEKYRVLASDQADGLYYGYLFLREVESGLRLMNTTARHELPTDPLSLDLLAFLIGWESGEALRQRVQEVRLFHCQLFEHFLPKPLQLS